MKMDKIMLDWNQYTKSARDVISEGCILLENRDEILPFAKNEKLSLFGRMQLHYYKSGTGSGGMVNVSKVYGILEGLLEDGDVEINQELLEIYRNWEIDNPFNEGIGWGTEPWSQEEMALTEDIVADARKKSDKAVIIIGRTAGEDKDFSDTKGAYRLSDIEEDMMEKVCRHFDKVVVLLNIGQLMDMSFIDRYNPGAVMIVWQGGMIGGLGTADVLTGKVTPSGKLPDTNCRDLDKYPASSCFGDKDMNQYKEDIYVGYRYYETFDKEQVRYPFGYGLSYTDFEWELKSFTADSTAKKVKVEVTVKNTGKRPGKEVIQLYTEAPQGKLGKALRVLSGFKKTAVIFPGAAETVTIEFSLERIASYDDSGVTGHAYAFVLEAGMYKFYAGTDVRKAKEVGSLDMPETVVCEQCEQALAPHTAFQRIKPVANGDGSYSVTYEDVPLSEVDEAKRRKENLPEEIAQNFSKHISLKDVYKNTANINDFVATLTDDDLACIVRGEGMGSSLVTPGTASAFGGVSEYLRKKDIPAVCCDDGPSGMRLDSGVKAFSLPSGAMISSTFNPELVERMYEFTGLEMNYNKVDVLLGPGINIHRHPLNGRNFEYFTEDPYLNGVFADAMLEGLRKYGARGCVKHFCGNNQETGRHVTDSVISERALREIYLRGFEYVVKTGRCDCIMTTYGQVNGMWTAGNYDLNTHILRKEWGFKGITMTDWWASVNDRGGEPSKSNTAAMVKAQNDLYMVVADAAGNSADDNTLKSLQDGNLTRAELQRCAVNICSFAMQSLAMKQLTKDAINVEIINKDNEEEEFDFDNVEYVKLDGNITISLTDKPSTAGTNYYFPLDIMDTGDYEIILTGSSGLNELAQVSCTLYYTGVPFLTYTFNGTGGKDVSISKSMNVGNRMNIFRLNVAKNGVDLKTIEFRKM